MEFQTAKGPAKWNHSSQSNGDRLLIQLQNNTKRVKTMDKINDIEEEKGLDDSANIKLSDNSSESAQSSHLFEMAEQVFDERISSFNFS
jgi:phosphopentomutase